MEDAAPQRRAAHVTKARHRGRPRPPTAQERHSLRWHQAHAEAKRDLDLRDRLDRVRRAYDLAPPRAHEETLEYRPAQERARAVALKSATGILTIQMATGTGKSAVAAQAAAALGRTIFVCPHRLAIGEQGDEEVGGISASFRMVFQALGRDLLLGRVNETSAADDVSFLTPRKFVSVCETQKFEHFLDGVRLLVVDEAHRFPVDVEKDLILFPKVEEYAKKMAEKMRVVGMTATHMRMDGKPPLGIEKPSFEFSIQEAVDAGDLVEIHGLQVNSGIVGREGNWYRSGDLWSVHLDDADMQRWLEATAKIILDVWHRPENRKPTAVFCRLKDHARRIAAAFNRMAAPLLGMAGLAVLTDDETPAQRSRIIEEVRKGQRLGFATVNLAEESLDLPCLEVLHLVRRTESIVRLIQTIGRGTRKCPGKRRCLVVDHEQEVERTREVVLIGLGLADFAIAVGSRTTPDEAGVLVGALEASDHEETRRARTRRARRPSKGVFTDASPADHTVDIVVPSGAGMVHRAGLRAGAVSAGSAWKFVTSHAGKGRYKVPGVRSFATRREAQAWRRGRRGRTVQAPERTCVIQHVACGRMVFVRERRLPAIWTGKDAGPSCRCERVGDAPSAGGARGSI